MTEHQHERHESGYYHIPMEKTSEHMIERIEYREIERHGNDGIYSKIGDEECNDAIAQAKRQIIATQASGKFPDQVTAPSGGTHPTQLNSSELSIRFHNDTRLYVFRLRDDANLIFDTRKQSHLFGIRLFPEREEEIEESLEAELKSLFSHPEILLGDNKWACFSMDGAKVRNLIGERSIRLAFDFHVIRTAPGPSHPPYWPAHSPDLF